MRNNKYIPEHLQRVGTLEKRVVFMKDGIMRQHFVFSLLEVWTDIGIFMLSGSRKWVPYGDVSPEKCWSGVWGQE